MRPTPTPTFMNILPLALIVFLFVSMMAVLIGLRNIPSSSTRILFGLIAMLFLLFVTIAGIFGFLASFELPSASRLPWQICYGSLSGGSLLAATRIASRAFRVKHL